MTRMNANGSGVLLSPNGAMYMLGVAMLFPWNAFLNVIGLLRVWFENSNLEHVYPSILSFSYLGCNFGFFLVVLYCRNKFSDLSSALRIRVSCFGTIGLLFMLLLWVVWVHHAGPTRLFLGILLCICGMGTSTANLQDAGFKYAENLNKKMETNFTSSIMNGQAIAGIVASSFLFITTVFFQSYDEKTMIGAYLVISAFVVLFAVTIFTIVDRHVSLYTSATALEMSERHQDDLEESQIVLDGTDFDNNDIDLQDQNLHDVSVSVVHRSFAVAVFLCFFVTLGVFPGLTSLVQPITILLLYFQPILVLLYNFGDLIGRLLAPRYPMSSGRRQVSFALCRFAFLPLISICNIPDSRFATVLTNTDIWIALLVIMLATTNGYLASNAMMLGCKLYCPTLMSLWLNLGLALGSLISNFVVLIIVDHHHS